MSPHLPIIAPPTEWFSLKEAAYYCGKHVDTLRDWVKTHGIGRQSVKNSKFDVSIVGLEMVRCGDLDALELLRAGDRSHPRVRHYLDGLTALGVLVPANVVRRAEPFPTAPNPYSAPGLLLSDQSDGGSLDEPAARDISDREVKHMRDEGSHAKVSERIRAILRSEEGQFLPTLANILAFDSDLSTSESLKILEVAANERRSQIAAASDTKRLGLQ